MLKSYLKIALRNFSRNKTHSFINILGLAIGFAFCVLVLLFVWNEYSYDRFHENSDRIYRVLAEFSNNRYLGFHPSLASSLQEEIPGIEHSARFSGRGRNKSVISKILVRYRDKMFEEDFLCVDPEVLEMFSFPLIPGSSKNALQEKFSVVISQNMATKYFGSENPLNKVLTIKTDSRAEPHEFMITGVFESIHENSSIIFDFLFPYENIYELLHGWGSDAEFFIQLQSSTDRTVFDQQLNRFAENHSQYSIILQPLTDIHFDTQVSPSELSFISPPSNPLNMYILTGIGLLILLIACINFINLSIAQSSTRIKEIGVRQIVGANRKQLINQFVIESILTSLLAFVLGLVLVKIFLPTFNNLIHRNLTFGILNRFSPLLSILGLFFITGFFASSSPAFILSHFQAVDILKAKFKIGKKNPFNKSLVMSQFVISIILISITILMLKQLYFVRTKDLGFNKDFIIKVNTQDLAEILGQHHTLRNKIMQHPNIVGLTMVKYPLYEPGWNVTTVVCPNGDQIDVNRYYVDYDFLNIFELKLIYGRNFSEEFRTDNRGIIVNNTFFNTLRKEMTEDLTSFSLSDFQNILRIKPENTVTIIGEVEDFYFNSLHQSIKSTVLMLNRSAFMQDPKTYEAKEMYVKIRSENISETIAYMERQWQEIEPNFPFKYSFLDEYIADFYLENERWARIINYAAALAIIIACMGVFGLISLAAVQRTKEIGIRKVLGATVQDIVTLLSKEYLWLIIAANLIAWPIAWYVMNKWLQNFAYHINQSWWIFALSGALALIVTLLTVSWQVIRAAIANPVESLRYE